MQIKLNMSKEQDEKKSTFRIADQDISRTKIYLKTHISRDINIALHQNVNDIILLAQQ